MAAVRIGVLFALTMLSTGCATRGDWLLGSKGVDILKSPTKVEAYHSAVVLPPPGSRDAVDSEAELMKPAQEIDLGYGPRISKLLLRNDTYLTPALIHRTSGFYPIVAYRVWKGADWVDVQLDFDLDVIQIRVFDSEHDATTKKMAFFDKSHSRFLRMTKEVFITYPPIVVMQ